MAFRPPFSVVTVAVLLFLLEVALARTPNEVDSAAAVVSDSLTFPKLPTTEVKPILRLPSETVTDEPRYEPDPDSQARDIHDPEIESAESITVRSVPLTLLRFHDLHPINRHFFPVRPRLHLRPCRHRHNHHAFLKPIETQAEEIPYGNDMVLSNKGEEKKDLDMDPVSWVSLPQRHHRHHHYHHHEDDNNDDEDGFTKYLLKHGHGFGREKFKKHFHHKHRDDDDEEVKENEEKKSTNGKKEGGGFVKRIRKFLNHF